MSKIILNNVSDITQATTAQATINSNSATIQTAMDNTLSRDGTSPNQMMNNIDMNNYRVLNLPQPATSQEPLRLTDLNSFVGGGTVTNIPAGGNAGDHLVKTSATNYAVGWQTQASDLVAGTNIAVTGSSPAVISTVNNPNFSTSVTTPIIVLAGTSLSGVTGTGLVVAQTSPTLITPILGAAAGTSLNLSGLTVSSAVATDGSKNLVSVTNTGTGNNVLNTSPTLVTPILGIPTSVTLTNATGLPVSTGITGAGTGVLTALAINVGTAGAFVTFNGAGGTPSSMVGTNITGTAAGLTAGAVSAANLTGSTLAAGVTASSLTSLGTITTLTATTINAHTLGGAISGGGNNINNVNIGVSSPGTGAFTTVSSTGNMTAGGGTGPVSLISNALNSGTGGGSAFVTQLAGVSNAGMGNYSKLITGGAFDATPVIFFGASGKLFVSGGDTLGLNVATASTSLSTGTLTVLSGGLGVAGAIWAGTYVATTATTVAGLPAAAAGLKGARMFVTDSNAVSFTAGIGAVVAAGGTTNVPVTCDGTNWRIG